MERKRSIVAIVVTVIMVGVYVYVTYFAPTTPQRLSQTGIPLPTEYFNSDDTVNIAYVEGVLDKIPPTNPPTGDAGGYDREAFFGPSWYDVDGNGCDTRNDILRRDYKNVRVERNGCTVVSGTLQDPYSGTVIDAKRGDGMVDIDHVVPLKAAYDSGAWAWSYKERLRFANDPINLTAVSYTENRTKSDKLAAEWLPTNKGVHCEYALVTTQVYEKYPLGIDATNRIQLKKLLQGCKEVTMAEVD